MSGPPIDARFQYRAKMESRGGIRQSMFGTELNVLEPVNVIESPQPRQIDFDISAKRPILCEQNTRLVMTGVFEEKGVAEDAVWVPIKIAEAADVMVQPLFFEQLIRSFELYCDNQLIKTWDEPSYVGFFLNMFMYWCMDPLLKRILCPQACHPANGIPTTAKSWNFAATGDWIKYAPSIFTEGLISFTWVPLFVFPFYQGSNWIMDKSPPCCVPINHLGKFTFRITFKDNWTGIFRKRLAANAKSYRFNLTKCQMVIEEVRMNPTLERSLYQSSKKTLAFPGVTRLAQTETPSMGAYTHLAKFSSIYMPEGIFIYALDKKVVGGTYKFGDMPAGVWGPMFARHNLIDCAVEFAGVGMALKEPNMFQINDDLMDPINTLDHMGAHAPFGMLTDPARFTLDAVQNGFAKTDFPHVHYNLCVGSGSERMVPALTDDPNIVTKMGDLVVKLKFGDGGAPQDMMYIVYVYYTDVNIMLDMKTKRFYAAYELR